MKRSPKLVLALVILATVLGAVFIYPGGIGEKWRPWRLGLDLVGGSHLVFDVDLSAIEAQDADSVLEGIRDVIERRVNLFGVSEPQVYIARADGKATLVVEIAGVNIKDAVRQIGETPLLDFREVEQVGTSTRFTATSLTGRYVESAQLDRDELSGSYRVAISFNDEGAKIFETLTEKNIGKPLAIFLDGVPISLPTVQEKIAGGDALISGDFTPQEARELVARFNAGALPAPVTLINEQTVSATLGRGSLTTAIFAGAVGTLLIALFMVFFYGTFGFFAVAALVVYIVLTLGVFKFIPIVLTLAGLAGFILTIGMAVDANVLIFERTKEELAKGLNRVSAIEEGFRRAWPSIRDSNVSTIITALILYLFTSSFIRGFALTLLIGVLTSMFSAITVTRTFLRIFMKKA